MPVRLDWRLGADSENASGRAPEMGAGLDAQVDPDLVSWAEGAEHRPEVTRAQRKSPGPWGGMLLALLLLILAGIGGFYLGQWSEARRFVVHGVESQLALEQLAWREGDRELYETTLDPWSTVEWRSAQVFEFVTHAPVRWEGRMVDLLPIEEGRRLQVTVEISKPGSTGEISIRFYELRGERWLRAEP